MIMCNTILITLLASIHAVQHASVAQTHGKKVAANRTGDAQDSMQFMDKLVNRGLKASSLHNDLDESTLGKNQVPGGEVDWQEDSSSIQEVLKASGGDKFTKAEKTPVKAMAMKTLKAVKAGKAMKAMKAMKGMQVAMNTAIKKKKKRVSKIARGKLAKASVFRGFKEKTASGFGMYCPVASFPAFSSNSHGSDKQVSIPPMRQFISAKSGRIVSRRSCSVKATSRVKWWKISIAWAKFPETNASSS